LPLEKVTTANLDALRAYSLATRALGEGKGAESISLFERASELDHDFAHAYLGLSNVYYTTGQKAKAKAYALKAGERVDRLSARERLTTEGYISLFATPAAMKEKWSLLAKLYPDALSGQNNLAFALWWYDNDLDEAARYFGEVARSRHPRRGYAWLLLGDIQTAEGRWEQARASYRTARQVGSPQLYLNPVHLDIALGDDAAATRTLAAEPTNGFPFFEVEKSLRGASLHVQHGRLARALDATRAAQRAASKAGLDNSLHRARLAEIAVSYALGSSEAPKLLRALVDDEIARLAKSTGPYDQGSYVHLTLAAMLALRHDDAALAERALDALEPKVEGSGYFSLEQPYQVARCESGLASDAAAAVACLEQARSPHAYYQTNVALLRAYSAAGKTEQARATAGALIEQRARGIIEYLGEFAAQVPNLIDADEALVARAAIDADAGRADAAQADLTRFLDAWRDGDSDAPLRRRALALQERLRSQQEQR
jgi:tetratricopeptide (TPR) repeat protein